MGRNCTDYADKEKRLLCPADLLLPAQTSGEKWAVIACDQFTSEPEYWEKVEANVGNEPSALRMILPEIALKGDYEERIKTINRTMEEYLAGGVFAEYPSAYIYVERTLKNGKVRKGIVGALDLEQYDYMPGIKKNVRATEKTVIERIPPRKRIRENAAVELSHVLLLCDDPKKQLIEPVTAQKDTLPVVYDFECMEGGGHLTGWLLCGEAADKFADSVAQYTKEAALKYPDEKEPLVFAVGDGNHSLATAKACYEQRKAACPQEDLSAHPARYAMVELGNIHDDAQEFEPIHRIVTGVDPEALLRALEQYGSGAVDRCEEVSDEASGPDLTETEQIKITWYAGDRVGTAALRLKKGQLPIAFLQAFLDEYLQQNGGEIDYIHGDDALKKLAEAENAVGFLLPAMDKGALFPGIVADGVLPRKTFSMGHAQEKRYYMEARKIR